VEATLYGIPMSHPVITARLALGRKGIAFRERMLLAGAHPLLLAAAGFRPTTVPALRLDGRRVQGSLAITRALEAAVPSPSLFGAGAGAGARAAIEEAEAWGERELQPVPRRLIRRTLVRSHAQRRWFAATATPLPAPGAAAVALAPTARLFARMVGASSAQTEADLAAVDGLLDRVDALCADGVIGGEEVNAADCQIAPSVRMLVAFEDLREQVERHGPAVALARRLVPEYPAIPAAL
jgi:glutathione S-transferase